MSIFLFRSDANNKNLYNEISALSGIPITTIREVIDYLFLSWVEKMVDSSVQEKKTTQIQIPFLGSVVLKYEGDEVNGKGLLESNVSCFVSLDDNFKKLVGDVYDEKSSVLDDILNKKMESALNVILEDNNEKK
jgi:hypothetical protein